MSARVRRASRLSRPWGRKRSSDDEELAEVERAPDFAAASMVGPETDGEPLAEFATVKGDPQGDLNRLFKSCCVLVFPYAPGYAR